MLTRNEDRRKQDNGYIIDKQAVGSHGIYSEMLGGVWVLRERDALAHHFF
jgi:hypothetical protein